jgi:hypothetical protein
LDSSDGDNYFNKRRTRQQRKNETNGTKTLTSSNNSELTGTEIVNRRSRKDRAADRMKTNSSSSSNSKQVSKPTFSGYDYSQN